MSAFKAANPNAVFEDFIRWHSPGDWETTEHPNPGSKLDWPPTGKLSTRMSEHGNSWRQIWNDVPALPASEHKPLLDPNREGEKVTILKKPNSIWNHKVVILITSRITERPRQYLFTCFFSNFFVFYFSEDILSCSYSDVGRSTPFLIPSLMGMAKVYSSIGRASKAVETYNWVVNILEKSRGTESEDVMVPLLGLGNLYIKEGKASDAENCFNR